MHTHKHAHTCINTHTSTASHSAASSKFQLSFPDSTKSFTWIRFGAFLLTICQWPVASLRVLAPGNVQHSNIEVVQLMDRACLSSKVLRPLGVGIQQPRKSHLRLQGILQPSIISLPKSSHCRRHRATDGLLCHNSFVLFYHLALTNRSKNSVFSPLCIYRRGLKRALRAVHFSYLSRGHESGARREKKHNLFPRHISV